MEHAAAHSGLFAGIIENFVPEIISILEIIGILVIIIGATKSFIYYLISLVNPEKNFRLKSELGSALSLGLEFKMGAEILKTVIIRDINEIWILGAIILLRALLTLILHFEMKSELEHTEDAHELVSDIHRSGLGGKLRAFLSGKEQKESKDE